MLSTKDQELKQDQKEMEQPTTRHGQVESQLREESQDEQFLNLEHKHIQPLAGKDQIAGEMKNLFNASYTCSISEPGLSTTANHQTHVIVELSDASGQSNRMSLLSCGPHLNPLTLELGGGHGQRRHQLQCP